MKEEVKKMKRIGHFLPSKLLPFLISALLVTGAYASEKKPIEIKKTDKCQVCGMFVAKYPAWIAGVVFKDGSYAAFDGPKDMFKFYFSVPKYLPSKTAADIEAIYVTEYYSAKLMDARGAIYVAGSDILGPMGPELIPLESMEKAKDFIKDHRGEKALTFKEVTSKDLR